MAVYSLLFGHAEWPADRPRRAGTTRVAPEAAPVERLTIVVPSALKSRVDASAELAGVPSDAWITRALARSVDPRLVAH
jgi:hypothetical protein